MKIEMGESLMRSWLRHCKKCQLAEHNWKPSLEWPHKDISHLTPLFEEAKTYFYDKLRAEIFKKTASVEQMLRQAEVDVLGLQIVEGKVVKAIAVDVAFHLGGLNYGSQVETAARVAKKLFRSALIVDTYFTGINAEVIFTAPKINPSVCDAVIKATDTVAEFFIGRLHNVKFRTISNNEFLSDILQPVLGVQESVADTSELFLRAVQLYEMFETKNESISDASKLLTSAIVHKSGSEEHNKAATVKRPIYLEPNNERLFRKKLLEAGKATIKINYRDGREKSKTWKVNRFSEDSSVMGNLKSRPEFRPLAWDAAGIEYVTVTIG